MKKEPALVLIKPDGLSKGLVGHILDKFSEARLDIVAMKVTIVTPELAKKHYKHIDGTKFFKDVINYLLGKYHRQKSVVAIIYYGQGAIKKCRQIAGATNPEEANPLSIRGAFGRITTKGLFENLVHVSSTAAEAKREIKLWFNPDDVATKLYPTAVIKTQQKVWK